MQLFNATPFLRIIIPYIFGIIFNLYVFAVSYKVAWVLFILMSIAFLFTFLTTYKRIQTQSRFVLLVKLDLLLFFTASLSCHLFNPTTNKQFIGNYYSTEPITFTAVVNDIPNQTKRGIKLNLEVKQFIKGQQNIPVTGIILAYVPANKQTQAIEVNDELAFSCQLFPIDAPKNPQAFNYKQYTHDLGISYICYPDSNKMMVLKTEPSLSLYQYGLKAKNAIINFLKASSLTPNSQSICNALLTGYDADVEQPIIDGFATTGTLHVLSVSGLHVGIIYLFLNFLLGLMDKYHTHRFLRFILITICLWGFAFISGFDAPILRAVIMFNVLGLGELLYPHRTRNTLNAVMCSAFLLLLFNPYLIRNGGFLLSYFAVIGLITIHPWLEKKWEPENGFLKIVWTNTSLSIAASIATLPITLYYFHFFPLWFIPCNLIVLPISYAVMALLPFMLIAKVYAAYIINYLINFLIQFNAFFSALSLKNMIYVQLSFQEVLLLYGFIIGVGLCIYYKRFWCYAFALSIICIWQVNGLVREYKIGNTNQLTVYYQAKQMAFSYSNSKQEAFFYNTDSLLSKRVIEPYLKIKASQLTKDSFSLLITDSLRFVSIQKKVDYSLIESLQPTHVFIRWGNVPPISFFENPQLKAIILHPQNSNTMKQQVKQLCYNFGVLCWDMRLKGYYQYTWKH